MNDVMTSVEFNDLHKLAGKKAYEGEWMSIDREHLQMFSKATYLDPDHVDLTFSKNNEFGSDLIDGFLLLSMLTYWNFKYFPMQGDRLWGLNYGLDKVRFVAPVMLSDRVRPTCTVSRMEKRGEGWFGVLNVTVEKEGSEKPAMTAEWLVLFLESPEK